MRERIKAKLFFNGGKKPRYLGTFEVVGNLENDYLDCQIRVIEDEGRFLEHLFDAPSPMRVLFSIENNPYHKVRVISRGPSPET